MKPSEITSEIHAAQYGSSIGEEIFASVLTDVQNGFSDDSAIDPRSSGWELLCGTEVALTVKQEWREIVCAAAVAAVTECARKYAESLS